MDNPAFVVELENAVTSVSQKNGKPHALQTAHSFEDAVTLTQIGKFHYTLLLVCGLCFMSVMVEVMGVSVMMPFMVCDLESTVSEQGILASSGFLGIVLSSHAVGFLADTSGRVRTLRVAIILAFLASVASAFSVNIWMLIVCRFLCGFFISGCQACVFSLCGEYHGNKTRVRHVTLLSGFLPLALVYLPFVATFVLPIQIDAMVLGMKFSSWRVLIICNSGLSILTFLGLWLIPESPKFVLVQGDHDGALEILRTVWARNTGRTRGEYPVQRIELQTGGANLSNIRSVKDAVCLIWSQTAALFYKERCLHTINIMMFQFVVYAIAQGIFMWFPTILNEMVAQADAGRQVCDIINTMDLGSGNSTVSDVCSGNIDLFSLQVLMVIGGVFVFFYLIFSYTIDIVGKRKLLLSWLVISSACAIAVHWTTNFYVTVVLMTLIMGVGNCGGIVSTISMEYYPTNINAMGMCFVMMVGRLGAVAGSNIMGQVLFNYCHLVYWILLAILVVLGAMGLFLPERKRDKKTKKEINSK